MIHEITLFPLNANRIVNQINNSVSLRYDTDNEQLQLVDNHGEFKTISVDTTEDEVNPEDIAAAVQEAAANAGFVTSADVAQLSKTYTGSDSIAVNNTTISVDTDWLEGFVASLGYVKVDNDIIYHADENSIVMDGNNTFSVATGWLTGFLATNGIQGPQGPQGQQGEKGQTGQKGQKGDQGQQGPAGEKGQKGDQGQKGQTGQKGQKGDQGQKGQTGQKGQKGDQGQKGQTGQKGQKGDQGQKGQTGQKGQKGDQGQQGPAGETIEYTAGDGIGIENNTISLTATIPTVPTDLSAFTNTPGYLTAHQDLSNYATTGEVANVLVTCNGMLTGVWDAIDEGDNNIREWIANNDTFVRDDDLFDRLSGAGSVTVLDKVYFDDKITISGAPIPTDLSAFTNSPGYLTAHQDLSNYALTSQIPTGLNQFDAAATSGYIASFGFVLTGNDKDTKYGVIENGGLTVSDQNFAIDNTWLNNKFTPYALISSVPTKVSDLNNDKSFVTLADLEAVKLSLLQQLGNMNTITEITTTSAGTMDQNLFVEVPSTITNNTTFNGKNITVQELSAANNYVTLSAANDVTITNMSTSGNLPKSTRNAAILVNNPGRVVITDSTLAQTGYNSIEIGNYNNAEIAAGAKFPKSILIDHVDFTGNLSNNAISIFGTADDAVVTVSNCIFDKCSNPFRISNRTNAHVTFNFVNCIFNEWELGDPELGQKLANKPYAGMIICQDYTSKSVAAEAANNLFGSDKITINLINCEYKGSAITFNNISEVAGIGYPDGFDTEPGEDDPNYQAYLEAVQDPIYHAKIIKQLIYVYYNYTGIIKYTGNENRYPTINVINN